MKKGQITFTGDHPMQIDDSLEQDMSVLSEAEQSCVDQIGATIKAYLSASDKLIEGKYAHLKDWVPALLR